MTKCVCIYQCSIFVKYNVLNVVATLVFMTSEITG